MAEREQQEYFNLFKLLFVLRIKVTILIKWEIISNLDLKKFLGPNIKNILFCNPRSVIDNLYIYLHRLDFSNPILDITKHKLPGDIITFLSSFTN